MRQIPQGLRLVFEPSTYFFALGDGRVCVKEGYAGPVVASLLLGGEGYISSLSVDEGYRRMGLGSIMLTLCKTMRNKLELDCSPYGKCQIGKATREFYYKNGFTSAGPIAKNGIHGGMVWLREGYSPLERLRDTVTEELKAA